MQRTDILVHPWAEYELLDSGEHMKLERFRSVILARPETQAIWEKEKPKLWEKANAMFVFRNGKGVWDNEANIQEWDISWSSLVATLSLTNFKHIGIFPEQPPNWYWIDRKVRSRLLKQEDYKVLNLFGYTGAASIVAAQAGAAVTHVDASKQSLDWAKANMILSGLKEDSIRWIFDDALQFVKRESKRGNTYDGIILDPPAFGRGAKGEVWHIEEDLPTLMHELTHLLKEDGFLLLNGYAAGYTPTSFLQLAQSHFPHKTFEYGELQIATKESERVLSQGIYARTE